MKIRIMVSIVAAGFALGCGLEPEAGISVAAASGDVREVVRLAKVESLNQRDRSGYTPLMYAARGGHTDVIRHLVNAGADPNLVDGSGSRWPSLIHAVHKGQISAAMALLEAGADPNRSGAHGMTPLIMASGYGADEIVALLLRYGARPDQTMTDGTSPLLVAATGITDIDRFTFGQCQGGALRLLLEKDPNLELPKGWKGRFARVIAKRNGCGEMMSRRS